METDKVSNEFVKLTVTTEGSDLGCERAFNRNITVGELKQRLELITGAAYDRMKLELRNKTSPNDLIELLAEDGKSLKDYPCIQDGLLLRVVDPSMTNIFDETDAVEKLSISDERYTQISNVRSYMQKYGHPKLMNRKENADTVNESERVPQEDLRNFEVGKRCEVQTKGSLPRRGEIKYIGEICVKPGITFIGVQLDEPLGKNDGTAGKVRYFECEPNYGVFVRPTDVEVGEFPELSIDDELDEI
ncbi:tubulin-specific chaperone B [Galendromus occidentalis]|uniref:Tubulin-specific chaperone B n=1 Tax=Galendromus occidentalis TaxID=34638 RepID=A0AAJ6QW60_9ACAR|nr:tubulin-specific chaperone B [Galendromus occidentalis]